MEQAQEPTRTHAEIIAEAVAEFPSTFGLKVRPDSKFWISDTRSFIDNETGEVKLLIRLKLWCGATDTWGTMTPEELRRQIVDNKVTKSG